jgi:hypothetical protein
MPWQFRMLAEGFVALTAVQQQKHPHLGMTGFPDLLGAPFSKSADGAQKE